MQYHLIPDQLKRIHYYEYVKYLDCIFGDTAVIDSCYEPLIRKIKIYGNAKIQLVNKSNNNTGILRLLLIFLM